MSAEPAPRLGRRQRLVLLLLAVLVLLWVGWAGSQRLAERLRPPVTAAAPPATVEVISVAPRSFVVSRRYPGTVDADQRAVVSARLTARVTEVVHAEGTAVKTGEVLVRLDDQEPRQEIERLNAVSERLAGELAFWGRQLSREQELYAQGLTTERNRDEAAQRVEGLEAQLAENRAALALLRTRLSYSEERAPFDGVIQQLHVRAGELATAGRPLIEVIGREGLKAVVEVPQRDLASLATGLPVLLELPALDQRPAARIDRLYPALDSRTRNASLVAYLPEGAAARPGMTVLATVELERAERAIAVPAHAVRADATGRWLWLVEEGQARRRDVKVGVTHGGWTRIDAGLTAGDVVIVTPDPRLRGGDAVRVVLVDRQ